MITESPDRIKVTPRWFSDWFFIKILPAIESLSGMFPQLTVLFNVFSLCGHSTLNFFLCQGVFLKKYYFFYYLTPIFYYSYVTDGFIIFSNFFIIIFFSQWIDVKFDPSKFLTVVSFAITCYNKKEKYYNFKYFYN